MFCPACEKLAILNTKKTCLRCKGTILNNLSSICDVCSKDQNVCSVCLKKLHLVDGKNVKPVRPGCRSCGR